MGAVHAVDALGGLGAWCAGFAGLALCAAVAGCSSSAPAAPTSGEGGALASDGTEASSDDAGASSSVCEVLDAPPPCVDPAPSFANDIFPMLNRDCNGTCHMAGGVAWPLTDYQDVSDWSLLIQIQLQQCEMPPTDAGALPPGDRDSLLNWIACGSPNN
jgi:hypothetical protein